MAQRTGCVGVRETHSVARELIDVGRWNLRIRVVATRISVPHIIDENQNYVRMSRESRRTDVVTERKCQSCKEQKEREKVANHDRYSCG